MAENWLSGTNLYQAKEPAFSREQKELLYPQVIYLPIDESIEGTLPPALTSDAIYLGRFEMFYPRMDCTSFLRYKIKAPASQSDAEERLVYGYSENPKKKGKSWNKNIFSTNSAADLDMFEKTGVELIDIAEKANIIDEIDGKYLADKLKVLFDGKYDAVVADAIDEQPYVSSNINTLMQKGIEVMSALTTVGNTAGANEVFAICYADIDDTETVVPHKMFDISVKRIYGRYPVRNRLRARLLKYGRTYTIGAQALMHLYRAIKTGRPQNTTVVTVAGECIGNPRNLEVRIGTTAREVIEFCGLIKNPSRIVMGGSMRGVAIADLDLPVLHTTRSVLAFEKPLENPVLNCISCGRCIDTCPRHLAPNYINKAFEANDASALKKLKTEKCVECGVCSYICPANLELMHNIKKAKKLLRGAEE